MPQVVIPNGCVMGQPGGAPNSPIVYCFADIGDPNVHADPKGLLAGCALGSTWQRVDPPDATHAFYIKTAQPSAGNANGTWTNK